MCEDRFDFQQPHGIQAGLLLSMMLSLLLLSMFGRSILCIDLFSLLTMATLLLLITASVLLLPMMPGR